MREFWITDERGFKIACRAWENEGAAPKAIIQVLHGMAEHSGRYAGFAEFLLGENVFTFASDHRGHGKTADENGMKGYFADECGWEKVLEDIDTLNKTIADAYPGIPIFILGHSMGSFLARDYMHSHKASGVILSGSAYKREWELVPARALAGLQRAVTGPKTPSKLMDRLSFGSFNNGFAPARTDFDWLSRDKSEVDKYIEDPFCGFVCTTGFFGDLLGGLSRINSRSFIGTGLKDTPLLLLSGENDPVGRNGKDLAMLSGLFEDMGYEDVSSALISEARHEILNEFDRRETWEQILVWISERGGF